MLAAKTWAYRIAAALVVCLVFIPYGMMLFRLSEADATHNLGLAFLRQGRYNDAARQFQKETQIVPYYSGAYNCWGIALKRQGHIPEAIALYHKALRLDPNNSRARNNLALALAKQSQPSR